MDHAMRINGLAFLTKELKVVFELGSYSSIEVDTIRSKIRDRIVLPYLAETVGSDIDLSAFLSAGGHYAELFDWYSVKLIELEKASHSPEENESLKGLVGVHILLSWTLEILTDEARSGF